VQSVLKVSSKSLKVVWKFGFYWTKKNHFPRPNRFGSNFHVFLYFLFQNRKLESCLPGPRTLSSFCKMFNESSSRFKFFFKRTLRPVDTKHDFARRCPTLNHNVGCRRTTKKCLV
jgi:hypothetical protein